MRELLSPESVVSLQSEVMRQSGRAELNPHRRRRGWPAEMPRSLHADAHPATSGVREKPRGPRPHAPTLHRAGPSERPSKELRLSRSQRRSREQSQWAKKQKGRRGRPGPDAQAPHGSFWNPECLDSRACSTESCDPTMKSFKSVDKWEKLWQPQAERK